MQGMRTKIPPKHIQAPTDSMNDTQIPSDTPRYPTDIPQTSHRHLQTSPRNTTCQQMTSDANRYRQTCSSSTCQCLAVSGGVCWRLFACHVPWRGLGSVWGMSGGVSGGIWVSLMEFVGAWMCLGGNWDLIPCSIEPKHYYGTSQKGTSFFTWLYCYIEI